MGSEDTREEPAGVRLHGGTQSAAVAQAADVAQWLAGHGLAEHAEVRVVAGEGGAGVVASLSAAAFAAWAPGYDTLQLVPRMGRATPAAADDDAPPEPREIVAAMLAAPQPFAFDSLQAWQSHTSVRRRIAQAARRTALSFCTGATERPEAFWHYDEDHGFLIKDGQTLIDALRAATQPDVTGKRYGFSCFRATEYVVLLGLAQEMQARNPALLAALTEQWRRHAIRSEHFQKVFLIEYGSMERPLPWRYFVPGDRVWFKNPDDASSDIAGYEGSWVIYLGDGRFSNFWKRDQPYEFDAKCVEVYHWRHAVRQGAGGEPFIDEEQVEALVQQTLASPQATRAVLDQIQRLRDPYRVFGDGGCIDASREYPRSVWPDAGMELPVTAD